MSGHSKWSQIKHKKAITDAKRGNLFSKLARNITIAARDGSDIESNAKLRLAIERARTFNVPKDNIDRAISKATSDKGAVTLTAVLYEGYGPGGSALLIQGVTDSKNRTAAEVRHILSQRGGKWAEPGSVSWLFRRVGIIMLANETNADLANPETELMLIDLGISDIEQDENGLTLFAPMEKRFELLEKLKGAGFVVTDSYDGFIPQQWIEAISETEKNRLFDLASALEETDDIENVWTNVKGL